MTGGSTSRSAGVLSRAAELARAREQSVVMHERLEEAIREESAAQRELTASRYELDAAEGQRRQAEDEVLRLKGEKNHLDILMGTLRGSLEDLAGELESLRGRLADNAVRSEAAERRRGEQESQAEERRRQAELALSGQSELLERSGQLSEEVAGKKEAAAALRAERASTLRRAEDLRQVAADLTGSRSQKESALESYRQNIAQARKDIASRRESAQALAAEGRVLRERLGALNEEKLALEAERTAKSRASQEMNETLLHLEREVSQQERKMATNALEEKQILDKLWEHYELSHSDAQAQRIELESVPRAMRRIGELKRDISALGAINIGAIEEFDRVNGRYTYLSEQRDDVEKAKEDLEGIIREITGQMTEIFSQQFKLLSESFQTTFVELFGGGQARLELEDEGDILGCGIEIKAQPPGKTLKTISLLSGGEKAFVAIALYLLHFEGPSHAVLRDG